VIIGLDIGGAENMLKRLLVSDVGSPSNTVVVSLTTIGAIGAALSAQKITVRALGMTSAFHFPIILWRLIRLFRHYRPTIVQTWMYHADFLGGLAARLAGYQVVWNVRSTNIPQGAISLTYWLVRLCAITSTFIPARVICCARAAKAAHVKLGYSAAKMRIIHNGYDFATFEGFLDSRDRIRTNFGFKADDIIIGAVGRFDPLKDFHNFVIAASKVSATRSDVKYLMAGRQIDETNPTLLRWIEGAGLTKKVLLLGERTDILSVLSAMDIFCLSSVAEAFPNVVVEAMAVGVPCVVTRAGDAAEILGNDDFVVPVQDPSALADALLRLCELSHSERAMLGKKGAEEVRKKFSIDIVRASYRQVYEETARQ
jgi:glycosyltransferase involved in cell wall biosynthesis